MSGGSVDEAQYLHEARQHTVEMCFWIASFTLMAYDYLCTFQSEVQYVWKCRRAPSLGFILFYLNRYLPFVDFALAFPIRAFEVSQRTTSILIPAMAWIGVFGMLVSQVIIYLRTYAIWNRNRSIFYILLALLMMVFITSIVVLVLQITEDLINQTSGRTTVSGKMIVLYSSIFSGEFVVVILTMVKACHHDSQLSAVWVRQLYQNGIIFCFCLLVCNATNMLLIAAAPASLKLMFMSLQRNLHSVLCNRVIFLILKNAQTTRDDAHASRGEQDYPLAIFTTVWNDSSINISSTQSVSYSWAQQRWII